MCKILGILHVFSAIRSADHGASIIVCLCCYLLHTVIFNPFSAGIDFRRQNLPSKVDRLTERVIKWSPGLQVHYFQCLYTNTFDINFCLFHRYTWECIFFTIFQWKSKSHCTETVHECLPTSSECTILAFSY